MTQDMSDDSTLQKSPSAGDPLLPVWNAELIEPGLEVAPATEHDKQYINPVPEGDKEAFDRATAHRKRGRHESRLSDHVFAT